MPWDEVKMSIQETVVESLGKRFKQDKEEIHIDLDLILKYKFQAPCLPCSPLYLSQGLEWGLR